jgi:excisionase family DNA binding protein
VVPNGLPELLRPQDVAGMLAVSVPRVYELAGEGKIASYKLGKNVRFEPRDVAEFIRACRRERRIGS